MPNRKIGDVFQIAALAAPAANVNKTVRLACLPNDNCLVVWTAHDGENNHIYGQLFNLQTTLNITNTLPISTYGADFQWNPEITALDNDRFAVTWSGWDTAGYGVYGQVLDQMGTRINPLFLVSTDVKTGTSGPVHSLNSLLNDQFMVVWQGETRTIFVNNSQGPVFSRLYDNSGEALSDVLIMDNAGCASCHTTSITTSNNQFLVAYTRLISQYGASIEMKLIDASGLIPNETMTLQSINANYYPSGVNLQSLGNNRIVATWYNYPIKGGFSYYSVGKVYDISANSLGDLFSLPGQLDQYTALTNERLVKTWNTWWTQNAGLYGQLYDLQGNVLGEPFIVSQDNLRDISYFSVLPRSNGDFFIGWTSTSVVDDSCSLYGQLLSGQSINNTAPELVNHRLETGCTQVSITTDNISAVDADGDADEDLIFTVGSDANGNSGDSGFLRIYDQQEYPVNVFTQQQIINGEIAFQPYCETDYDYYEGESVSCPSTLPQYWVNVTDGLATTDSIAIDYTCSSATKLALPYFSPARWFSAAREYVTQAVDSLFEANPLPASQPASLVAEDKRVSRAQVLFGVEEIPPSLSNHLPLLSSAPLSTTTQQLPLTTPALGGQLMLGALGLYAVKGVVNWLSHSSWRKRTTGTTPASFDMLDETLRQRLRVAEQRLKAIEKSVTDYTKACPQADIRWAAWAMEGYREDIQQMSKQRITLEKLQTLEEDIQYLQQEVSQEVAAYAAVIQNRKTQRSNVPLTLFWQPNTHTAATQTSEHKIQNHLRQCR